MTIMTAMLFMPIIVIISSAEPEAPIPAWAYPNSIIPIIGIAILLTVGIVVIVIIKPVAPVPARAIPLTAPIDIVPIYIISFWIGVSIRRTHFNFHLSHFIRN